MFVGVNGVLVYTVCQFNFHHRSDARGELFSALLGSGLTRAPKPLQVSKNRRRHFGLPEIGKESSHLAWRSHRKQ